MKVKNGGLVASGTAGDCRAVGRSSNGELGIASGSLSLAPPSRGTDKRHVGTGGKNDWRGIRSRQRNSQRAGGTVDAVEAWNASNSEPDPSARRDLIRQAMVEDGVLVMSSGTLVGVEEIAQQSDKWFARWPDFSILGLGKPERVGDFVRWRWAAYLRDSRTVLIEGVDFGHLNEEDGRLNTVVAFDSPL